MPDSTLLISGQAASDQCVAWGRLIGASTALAVAEYARERDAPMLLLAEDPFRGVTVVDGKLVLPDAPGLGVSRV